MLRDPFAALLIVTNLCTDVSPPSEKIGRRDVVSSPDFFLREGGPFVHRLIVTENRGLKQRRFQKRRTPTERIVFALLSTGFTQILR